MGKQKNKNSNNVTDINELISKIEASPHFLFAKKFINKPIFIEVLKEYLKGFSSPILLEMAKKHHHAQFSVYEQSMNFIMGLVYAESRVKAYKSGIDIDYEKTHIKNKNDWEKKKIQIVNLLNEAVGLLESGESSDSMKSGLEDYKRLDEEVGIGIDEISWCGLDNLRRWIDVISFSPVEVVFPEAQCKFGVELPLSLISFSGGASKDDSAFRAAIIRKIAQYVPVEMKNRYSTISKLINLIGIKINPHLIRSILLRGHT